MSGPPSMFIDEAERTIEDHKAKRFERGGTTGKEAGRALDRTKAGKRPEGASRDPRDPGREGSRGGAGRTTSRRERRLGGWTQVERRST